MSNKCTVREANNISHLREENEYSRQRTSEEFFTPPCRICGQDDHTIIRETRDKYGYKTHEYSCPVSLYEDWNEATKLMHNGNKYRISPEKLVKLYDYNLATIDEALFKFRNYGSGKYISVKANHLIRAQIQELCEQRKIDMANLKREGMDVSHLPPIYCDLDGVLADFDQRVKSIFDGRSPDQIPPKYLWKGISKNRNFFRNLPWTKDGQTLWDSIRYLNPYILTGIPRIRSAEQDKRQWVNEKLGPDVVMIACLSANKYLYCLKPGAILIDDRESAGQKWELAGGRFILHSNAIDTIKQLQQLGIPVDAPNIVDC